MILFKDLGIFFIAGLALSTTSSAQAHTYEANWENKYNLITDLSQTNEVAQALKPIPSFRRLAGSNETGLTITNQEESLACTLKKWQLIGMFRDNQIRKTKGELTFQLTNNGTNSQKFVLAELLFLNDLETPLVVSNPHRRLQGEFIKLEPPLEPREMRDYTSTIWYKSNWHKVQLKTCRWLERGSDYWQIYPELKPKSKK